MCFQFVFAALAAIAVCLVQWYLKRKTRMDQFKKIPSSTSNFLFGDIINIFKMHKQKNSLDAEVYLFERTMALNYLYMREGLNTFWMGPVPVVTVYTPEWMEKILSSNSSLEKSDDYTLMQNFLGLGLITSSGSRWRSRRKLLSPCFHFRILADFLPAFHEQSLVLVRKLQERAENEFVDFTPLATLCALDIVCATVMGCHVEAQSGQNAEYATAASNLADNYNYRSYRPWLNWDFIFRMTKKGREFDKDLSTVNSFTRKVIQQKKEALLSQKEKSDEKGQSEGNMDWQSEKEEGRRRKALLDLLLDQFFEGGSLTEEDIHEEVETFMFAGHDTSAMAMTYAFYCLGLYPDAQGRVHDELDAIFHDDVNRAVEMDDIRNMKYLECVLKESQRIFPSVPIIGRKLQESLSHNGIMIPRGTNVFCHIMSLHRRPDLYPDPEVFDPERFQPDNSRKRHAYAYVPFSAGPRNCIGQKFAGLALKVVVANILRHFRVVSLDPRDQIHVKMEITLRPVTPIRLKFLPRQVEKQTS